MTTVYHSAIATNSAANAATFNVPFSALDTAIGLGGGGAGVSDNILKAWAINMQMQALSSITRNNGGLMTDASVTWLDGSGGTFAMTHGYNAAATLIDNTDEDLWEAAGTYQVSHSLSSQNVTVTITRDSTNNVTAISASIV